MESTQHILDRVRSPRVHITYDVEIGDAIQMKELPFVVGIIADLSGMPLEPLPKLKFRKFIDIDRDNFNDIMSSITPRLVLEVPNRINKKTDASANAEGNVAPTPDGNTPPVTTDKAATEPSNPMLGVELTFKNMDDFGPVALLKQIPILNSLYESRVKLCDLVTKLEGNDPLQELLKSVVDTPDLQTQLKQQIADHQNASTNGTPIEVKEDDILQKIFKEGKLARVSDAEIYACDILLEFLTQLDKLQDKTRAESTIIFSENIISDIEAELEKQINEIIHEPNFQSLEGTWRALNYLIMNTETSTHLKLRVLNATKKELLDDVEKAIEFDQSALFKKIYEEEYGTFGGSPYSCLVGGYEFTRHPQDIELLSKLSNIAAAAHAPFIAAASPRLFDFDSFIHLGEPRDLAKIFESTEMIKWRSFRNQEDSRYVALTLPHVLMRLPYGPDTLPVDGLNFHESITGPDNSKFCWGNAAFVLAQRITNAVALYNWPAAIRGVEGGGLVENLPSYTFKTTDGDIALKCPTEIAITDRREKELTDLGFIAICHSKGTDFAAFFGGQTTQKPKLYNTDSANANAALSTKLPYILAASRFAHYIKSIMRDKVGSFLTKDNVAQYLNNWITNYVLLNDDASQDMKAKMPLREARVDVFDIPGKPGYYKATIFLRPHFQLEGLTASIRLVATLPPPPAA